MGTESKNGELKRTNQEDESNLREKLEEITHNLKEKDAKFKVAIDSKNINNSHLNVTGVTTPPTRSGEKSQAANNNWNKKKESNGCRTEKGRRKNSRVRCCSQSIF